MKKKFAGLKINKEHLRLTKENLEKGEILLKTAKETCETYTETATPMMIKARNVVAGTKTLVNELKAFSLERIQDMRREEP